MTNGEKEKSTDEGKKTEMDNESGNKGVIIVVGIVIAVILGLVLFSNGRKAPEGAADITMAQDLSADDGWIKVLRPNTSDFVVMQFVLEALPQCHYFHFQTMMDGRALGIRCFERSDRDKPDYYYVISGTSEFLGPYKSEKDMTEKATTLMESLRAQAIENESAQSEDESSSEETGEATSE